MTENMMVSTLGGDFTITLEGGAKITTSSEGTSNIIATDVQGTNGVIHAISAVLIP
ncbi:MAG: fasciclin domain-containing protein [Bacteroidota bacterium]